MTVGPRVNRVGFTILELMIVLALVGGLTVIALPKAANAKRSWTLRNATNRFFLAHSLARSTAIRYGRVAELHIDPAGSRFWVEVDSSGTGIRDTVGAIHDFGGKVAIASNRTLLCLDSRGLATARGACDLGSATLVFTVSGGVGDTLQVTTLGKALR